ncbi:DUF4386 domain-containing protein [Paenibacillus sp. OAS669]|uniref:DUF4386 domain-containing protein n=1 Tax=Paenibacillus sp. OAS669 TaxID=2663821 RepID=UPI00178A9332|nr:DUF4386 domain-containing protein [Paenibacillus sp. OAS669]
MQQRTAALAAGISLIVMALAAFFSYGYAHGTLINFEDADATLNRLMSSSMLFKAEILGWLIILICDIIVAWAFYVFLKPYHHHLSLLGAWFRLIYTSILGAAILNLFIVMILTGQANVQILLETPQQQAQVMVALAAFESTWSFGLIVFGGHLLITGLVAYKADPIPRWISILLLIAALGYLFTHLFSIVYAQENKAIEILTMILTVPMTIGELGFGLWLLFRGGKSVS